MHNLRSPHLCFLPIPKYLLQQCQISEGPKSKKLVSAYFSVRLGKIKESNEKSYTESAPVYHNWRVSCV